MARSALSVADPALEIAAVHNPQNQDHSVVVEHVVHHAVVANSKTVERIAHTIDGLDGLAADPTLLRCVARQPLKGPC